MPKQSARPVRRKANYLSITEWRRFATHRIVYMGLAIVFAFGIVAYFGSGPGGSAGSSRSTLAARAQEPVAVINGEAIPRSQYETIWDNFRRQGGAGSDLTAANFQGMILSQLVDDALARSIAKKQGLKVTDADIDAAIAEIKQKGAGDKPLTDDQFNELLTAQGQSIDGLRDELRTSLLSKVLRDKLANDVKITEDDVLKNHDEYKVRHILVSTQRGLPDAQARTKAEKILAEVKSGKDFAELANQYSDDPSNKPTKFDPKTKKMVTDGAPKGGDLGWSALSRYVPEFADAARALKKGEVSPVVKTSFGYHIIKVEDTRRNLPKDFAKNKDQELKSLKQERSQKAYTDLMDSERKIARIEWKDPALKWRYDYGKSGGGMMGMMNPQGGPDTQKAQDDLLNELRGYVGKNRDDAGANLVLAQMLNQKLMMSSLSLPGKKESPMAPAERDKLRAEIITAYDSALKRTEDQNARFTLAQLYQENRQNDKALDEYKKIQRSLKWDDTAENKLVHQRLESAFKALGQADLATEETKKIAELTEKEKQEAAKRAEEAKKAAAARAATDRSRAASNKTPGASDKTPGAGGAATTAAPLPPGGSQTVTVDTPKPGGNGAAATDARKQGGNASATPDAPKPGGKDADGKDAGGKPNTTR